MEDVEGSFNGTCQSVISSLTQATVLNASGSESTVMDISNGTAHALPIHVRWSYTDKVRPFPEYRELDYQSDQFIDSSAFIALVTIISVWVFFLLVVACCSRTKRRRKKRIDVAVAEALKMREEEEALKAKASQESSPANSHIKAELADTRKPMEEMPDNPIFELPIAAERHEASELASRSPAEMEGSYPFQAVENAGEKKTKITQSEEAHIPKESSQVVAKPARTDVGITEVHDEVDLEAGKPHIH
jgi:hypothetical protein